MTRGAASTPSAANTLIDISLMHTEQSRHSDIGQRAFKLRPASPFSKKGTWYVELFINFIEIRVHCTVS